MDKGVSGNSYVIRYIKHGEISTPKKIVVHKYCLVNFKSFYDREIVDSVVMSLGLRLSVEIVLFVVRGVRSNPKINLRMIQSPDDLHPVGIVGVSWLCKVRYNEDDILSCVSYFLSCGEVDAMGGNYRVWVDMRKELWNSFD